MFLTKPTLAHSSSLSPSTHLWSNNKQFVKYKQRALPSIDIPVPLTGLYPCTLFTPGCCPGQHDNFPGLFAGHDPTRGSGDGVFKVSRVGSGRVGSGQESSKSQGSGRVGSRGFQISRAGLGRVNIFSSLTGRIRAGQQVMKSSRARSSHDPRETRGSGQHDPRVVFC